ncbi:MULTISPECIES: hypothetical protein [Pseudomonas]|jgi:hypothetical protein|uniref:hypothetical protein n=1 Tax=Pseudomonas TaxID=286 RepID=UPI000876DF8A|nr:MULTISPECIES: hypothetical protein [Pseudomonas]MDB6444806.1 hypothetical protein [Pseudomonas sp. 21TX0197]MDT8906022.1 hypothetical protein [Pseudomonas prosekii]NHN67653.1 hypothetical protein [Pseudomonas fluorescens]ROO33277.1 hypothetical protein BIV09_23070 [Pseudomonas sp. 7SR1]ROO36622.1 hypothetical protein BIV08_03645 [Pseudomonas sp. AF76]
MTNQALVLRRHTKTLSRGGLQCREVELRLAEDGHHVLLSRYVERYHHEQGGECIVQHHQVSMATLIRWMTEHGERVRA